MKKIFYFCIAVFLFGVIIGYLFLNKLSHEDKVSKEMNVSPQEILKTNSVEENSSNTVTVDSQEEKVSPRAVIAINKHYKGCNHTITNLIDVPTEMVNLTEEKIKELYPEWKIIDFNRNQVSLYKDFDGICNEHFVVKNNDGVITVYYLNEAKEEFLYEVTDISVEYLTDGDKDSLEKGIFIYGKNELNALLENFE